MGSVMPTAFLAQFNMVASVMFGGVKRRLGVRKLLHVALWGRHAMGGGSASRSLGTHEDGTERRMGRKRENESECGTCMNTK